MARILIAEDDTNIREIMAGFLKRQGHSVQEAADGVEALSLAQQDQLDLLVTDIGMPEKDGLELITDLRKTMPDLTILAMSAEGICGVSQALEKALACGANQTLSKPFFKQQFLQIVSDLLAQRTSKQACAE